MLKPEEQAIYDRACFIERSVADMNVKVFAAQVRKHFDSKRQKTDLEKLLEPSRPKTTITDPKLINRIVALLDHSPDTKYLGYCGGQFTGDVFTEMYRLGKKEYHVTAEKDQILEIEVYEQV